MTLVTPDWKIEIAGQTYTLDGGFGTLKAIQHEVNQDIRGFIIGQLRSLPFDRMARIISIGIKASGTEPPKLETIEQAIVDDIGIEDTCATLLRWLSVAASPKREREKKALDLEKILARSRGMTTSESQPASSDGP